MSQVTSVSQTTFNQDVLQSKIPVLVDFYADWCGPCQRLAPVLQRLAAEFDGRVKIAKVNIDHEPQLASQFRVHSVPTLVFVADGKIVGQTPGAAPEGALRNVLNQLAALSTSAPPA